MSAKKPFDGQWDQVIPLAPAVLTYAFVVDGERAGRIDLSIDGGQNSLRWTGKVEAHGPVVTSGHLMVSPGEAKMWVEKIIYKRLLEQIFEREAALTQKQEVLRIDRDAIDAASAGFAGVSVLGRVLTMKAIIEKLSADKAQLEEQLRVPNTAVALTRTIRVLDDIITKNCPTATADLGIVERLEWVMEFYGKKMKRLELADSDCSRVHRLLDATPGAGENCDSMFERVQLLAARVKDMESRAPTFEIGGGKKMTKLAVRVEGVDFEEACGTLKTQIAHCKDHRFSCDTPNDAKTMRLSVAVSDRQKLMVDTYVDGVLQRRWFFSVVATKAGDVLTWYGGGGTNFVER